MAKLDEEVLVLLLAFLPLLLLLPLPLPFEEVQYHASLSALYWPPLGLF